MSVKADGDAGRTCLPDAQPDTQPDTQPGMLPPPGRLLRHPSAVMFLLMREAYRLGHRRAHRPGASPAEAMRFPHYAILGCLEEFGSASQKEVADRLRFDASDLVGFVDFLERARFVVRRRDPRDRRRYALALTAAGRRALERRDREAERLNQELFAPLRPDEREQLRRLLLRALAHHDPRVPAADPGGPDAPAAPAAGTSTSAGQPARRRSRGSWSAT